jgi:hypothetical protein
VESMRYGIYVLKIFEGEESKMMKPPVNYLNQQLESDLVTPQQLEPHLSKWHLIRERWQRFLASWHRRDELQIWQNCDRLGQLRWSAYDPQTGKRINQVSETEMRAWLEQRNFITKPDQCSEMQRNSRIHPSR